jgi:hypothetical protein
MSEVTLADPAGPRKKKARLPEQAGFEKNR